MVMPARKAGALNDLHARPSSPAKHSPTPTPSAFRPKAKVNVNTDATLRKPLSTTALHSSHARSRPSSPFKPSPSPRVTVRPTVSPSQANLEPRQRALTTTASAKLKLPHPEDRPRSGSVIALHHALSISDLNRPSSPAPPVPTPPVLAAPLKVRSRLTGLLNASSPIPPDAAARSLSPPYPTTRPIHTRDRAPSITTTFSLNDPSPSSFYPITTASPAANPHRYAPRRVPSPARTYPSPTLASEPHPARKSSLVPKVDPGSEPLPPQSPPISALSLSSRSSVSKSSPSLYADPTSDNPLPNILSHIRRRSMERVNPFFSQSEIKKRDRSRSKERERPESDTESEGSERQLKAEAKTNRKIADLEITNRSLLAINASLETTKNRQAKEIRDLRRKLRESRLILPPRTFNAVKTVVQDEREGEEEEEDEEESDVEEGVDETFQRVRGLIDGLIKSGKQALETRPEDFRANLATKVLNADELRSWRDSGQRDTYMDTRDADDKTVQGLVSPALVAMPDSDGELAEDASGSSALPPTLTFTHSL